jgi:hypothetical protein
MNGGAPMGTGWSLWLGSRRSLTMNSACGLVARTMAPLRRVAWARTAVESARSPIYTGAASSSPFVEGDHASAKPISGK